MPKRLLTWSRTDPARTIVFVVGALTAVMQLMVFLPGGGGNLWLEIPNALVVLAFCGWAVWAAATVHVKHLSLASFWLFVLWIYSGITRLLFSPDPQMLLWSPFIVVSAALAVCYLYLSHQRKVGVMSGTDQ
mgnify:CR=1 FL=1